MAINITGNGGTSPPTVSDNAPYNAGTGQADDGKFVVYGGGGSSLYVIGNSTAVTFATGSIYMPGGTVTGGGSTSALYLGAGQAVTDKWDIQTGDQSNPGITYNAAYDGVSQETLRLLE
jgi:hypothetical protein